MNINSSLVSELTDFEQGLNGWEFRYWMPDDREIRSRIIDTGGFGSKHCFEVYADGTSDDGVFFLQKILTANKESPFVQAAIAWAFKAHKLGDTTTWPRIAYIGTPKDLAIREHKDKFKFFRFDEGVSSCETCDGWLGQMYKLTLKEPLVQLQICVGFKINWETTRTVWVDNIVLNAA
jgi:hypothetical protein